MQYFENFSAIYYDINGKKELVIDILKRALIKSNVINNIDAYIEYNVKDGDSLQSISYSLYDSVYPFWIIMLINQNLNPYFSLPIDENVLKKQAIIKYGENNLYNIHHYEDDDGNTVDSPMFYDNIERKYYRMMNNSRVYVNSDLLTVSDKESVDNVIEVSNWQYELNENEKKRTIKLLRPEYLDSVISEFNEMVG